MPGRAPNGRSSSTCFRGYPELRTRLSFVPGNHDMNIIDRTNPALLDLPWSAGQSLRQLRVVLALDAIQGERAHVVDHASGALGPSLKDYLRDGERAELLRALAQRGTLRGRMGDGEGLGRDLSVGRTRTRR